jgi:hypothetical protein
MEDAMRTTLRVFALIVAFLLASEGGGTAGPASGPARTRLRPGRTDQCRPPIFRYWQINCRAG